jgi:hypothetical protein
MTKFKIDSVIWKMLSHDYHVKLRLNYLDVKDVKL